MEFKRDTSLPIRELQRQVDSTVDQIKLYLNSDVTDITIDRELQNLAIKTKTTYKRYTTLSKQLTSRYLNFGSIAVAEDERSRRNHFHDECYQLIEVINGQRSNIGGEQCSNISDLTSNSIDDQGISLKKASNLQIPSENTIPPLPNAGKPTDSRDVGVRDAFFEDMPRDTSSPKLLDFGVSASIGATCCPGEFQSATVLTGRSSQNVMSRVEIPSTSMSKFRNVEPVSFNLRLSQRGSNTVERPLSLAPHFRSKKLISTLPERGSQFVETLQPRPPIYNRNIESASTRMTPLLGPVPQPPEFNFISQTNKFVQPTSFRQDANLRSCGNREESIYPHLTNPEPSAKLVQHTAYPHDEHAQGSSHIRHDPTIVGSSSLGQRGRFPQTEPVSRPVPYVNTSENYLRKMELFKPTFAPFSGEPHKFHTWLNIIENEIANVNLSPIDTIKVLIANTTGEPLKLIEDLFYAGAGDPHRALENIVQNLKRHFGSDMQVASSLVKKVREFPPIKYMSQGKQVRELLHLCQLIDSYKNVCNELKMFDLSSGLREIWSKLPDAIINRWRSRGNSYESLHYGSCPGLTVFIEFLEEQVNEMCNPNYERLVPKSQNLLRDNRVKVLKTEVEPTNIKPNDSIGDQSGYKENNNYECPVHQSNKHSLSDCQKFKFLCFEDKRQILIENRRCFKCTGKHMIRNCKNEIKCEKCNGNHSVLLHNDKVKAKQPFNIRRDSNLNSQSDRQSGPENSLCTVVCNNSSIAKNCSKTVLVELTLPSVSEKKLLTYAILDDQSSTSFVDPSVIHYFDAPVTSKDYSLITLQGMSTQIRGHVVDNLVIKGINCNQSFKLPPLLTNNAIPNTKNEVASPKDVEAHPHICHLARYFNEIENTAQVTLLLGRNCNFTLPVECFGNQAPYVYKTNLGYSLIGNACTQATGKGGICLKTQIDHEHYNIKPPYFRKLDDQMFKLPLSEHIFDERQDDETLGYSADEQRFIKLMNDRVYINQDNHITLPLPFKESDPFLPNNQQAVYCRTKNTLDRLKNDQSKLQICITAMQKNLDARFVEEIPEADLSTRPGKAYWLPIFPVSHPKKKLRLVFDSSAKFEGTCFNDYLLKGPDENNRLKGVLLRFRKRPIGFSSDVEAMFNQFHVFPEETDFLRFYWFRNNNPEECIVQYRARVHIFGNKPSPSVANFGLKYAVNLEPEAIEARKFIHENVYVDDGLCSANTPEEAIAIIKSTRQALGKVDVRMCKIMSNSSEVLDAFPKSEIAKPTTLVEFKDNTFHGALGITWNIENDSFIFVFKIPKKPFTKRGIVSILNSFFDPLGFISPVIITGRILQRKILSIDRDSNDGWDKELPSTHKPEWESWLTDLEDLKQYSIQRSFIPLNAGNIVRREVHTFADASFQSIAYVSYLRSVSEDNKVYVSLISASSRLAPKCTTSIPRLELCSAVAAAIATVELTKELDIEPSSVTLYSDSTVTLGYLKNSSKRFSKYVGRRVSSATKCFSPNQWNYVPTDLNPADIATRPITVMELIKSKWISGPDFLCSSTVPQFTYNVMMSLPEAVEEETVLQTSEGVSLGLFGEVSQRINDWTKLKRISLFVLKACKKFSSNIRDRNNCSFKVSMIRATKMLFRDCQHVHFRELIRELRSGLPINNNTTAQLSPFLDADGLVRVGGRLSEGPFSFEEKHPLFVPSAHPIAKTIILHHHLLVKHQGRLITSGALRSSGFFIQNGSSLVKKIINNCFVCRKLRAPTEFQKMSDLPSDRLSQAPPFTHSGIDVCGPFEIKTGVSTRRGSGTDKMWVLVITCLYSRATHCEILPSMDTSTFINAYRRFVALRGPCKRLVSDCGTNFVAARNLESNFSFEGFQKELIRLETEWDLIPPHASHFGGVWERKVGSFKRILSATLSQLKQRRLTHDEFATIVAEATCIMNNTPLCDSPYNPNEPLPLTPALLLTQKLEATPPPLGEFTSVDILSYGKNRYKRVQHLSNYFWHRWKNEYLDSLNKRKKWCIEGKTLKLRDLVLVKEKNSKRNKWPIGIIEELLKSTDGRIRSVIVSTIDQKGSKKFYERPIVDLVFLTSSTC